MNELVTATTNVQVAKTPRGIIDKPPEFAFIPKRELAIDADYQRNLSKERVKNIAANWSWAACGALKIALRPNGDWYVFDGQHRLAGAMLREDVDLLPSLVFEMETVREEALGYLAQTSSKPMSVVDRFKAMLIARDSTALAAQVMLVAAGFAMRAGVKPGERAIGCAGEFLKWVENDPATTHKLFPVLVAMVEHGGMITDRVLRGSIYIEQRLATTEESLTDPRWRKRFAELSVKRVTDSLRTNCELEGNSAPRTCAKGLLLALNHGLTKRLRVPGLNDRED
jgi:hypothetical protein